MTYHMTYDMAHHAPYLMPYDMLYSIAKHYTTLCHTLDAVKEAYTQRVKI